MTMNPSTHGRAAHWAFLGYSVFFTTSALAQLNPRPIIVQTVQVFDEIKRGVRAEIKEIAGKSAEAFTETDEEGKAKPNRACTQGTRFKAIAKVKFLYRESEPVECGPSMPFFMQKNQIAVILLERGNTAKANGDPGLASMLYLEAAVRFEGVNAVQAKEAQIQGYRSLTKLMVPRPGETLFIYDTEQESAVLTKAGIRELKEIQQSKGLRVTGQVDYRTLEAVAGTPIGGFVKSAYIKSEKAEVAPR